MSADTSRGALPELISASCPAWLVVEPATSDISCSLCAQYCSCSSYENISGTIFSTFRLDSISLCITLSMPTNCCCRLYAVLEDGDLVLGTVGQDFSLQAQKGLLGSSDRNSIVLVRASTNPDSFPPLLCWGKCCSAVRQRQHWDLSLGILLALGS